VKDNLGATGKVVVIGSSPGTASCVSGTPPWTLRMRVP